MATPTAPKAPTTAFTAKRRVLRLRNGKLAAFTLAENNKFVNVEHANGRTSRLKLAHAVQGVKTGKLQPSTVQAFTAAQKTA